MPCQLFYFDATPLYAILMPPCFLILIYRTSLLRDTGVIDERFEAAERLAPPCARMLHMSPRYSDAGCRYTRL